MAQRLDDKLESEEGIESVRYDPEDNTLTVMYDYKSGWGSMTNPEYFHEFTDLEVQFIRQGKLTPLTSDGKSASYDVHITLGEQERARASKFEFSD